MNIAYIKLVYSFPHLYFLAITAGLNCLAVIVLHKLLFLLKNAII